MPETENTLPPVTDVSSAALHIEGLLDLSTDDARDDPAPVEDNESTEGGEPQEEDAAPDDMPASEDEDGSGEPEQPAIEAPKSWTAEEQAKFKELPPDLQQVVLRRESERDKAISQRMQTLAEERKTIESQVQNANAVQQQYANTLQHLLSLTLPELQQVESTNWQQLAQEDPAEYVRMSAVRDGLRQRVSFMQQQAQQAQQQQLVTFQQQFEARRADQYQQLIETVPDFADKEKAKSLVGDITNTMHGYGFTDDELGSVVDARMVRVMHRLAQLEKAEAARRSGLAKKGGAPAPKLMPANASPVREDNQNRKVAEQYNNLRKSGTARDAARLIENIL